MEATTTNDATTIESTATNTAKPKRRGHRARRGRSEGSCFQRADGLWCASVSLGLGANGKRRRRTIYKATKAAVLEELARLVVAGPNAVHFAHKVTIAVHLERWLREVAGPTIRANTLRSYTGVVAKHIKPHLGHLTLAKLTTSHLQTFFAERHAAGVGGRTLQIALIVLRQALANAKRLGLVDHNVALDADRPSHSSRTIDHHDADEVGRVLAKAAETIPELAALFETAYDTGARQGEIFGMQTDDLDVRDVKAATWTVRHNLLEVAGDPELTDAPKTQAGHRVIALSERCARALRKHHAHRAQRALDERVRAMRCEQKGDLEAARRARENADRFASSPFVFVDSDGKPLRKSNFLRRVHDPLMKAAGVREVTPHGLRHTNATLLLSRGVQPHVVARRLGHRDVATTLRIYAAVLPSQQREAADAMGALLDASEARAGTV